MAVQHFYVESLSLRAFKSVAGAATHRFDSPHATAVVGANGCGKTCLLEAIAFACGCPAAALRARTLSELRCAGAEQGPTAVYVTLRCAGTSQRHVIAAQLTHDGARALPTFFPTASAATAAYDSERQSDRPAPCAAARPRQATAPSQSTAARAPRRR
jgi:recombinational DNA repair ATPase RecF